MVASTHGIARGATEYLLNAGWQSFLLLSFVAGVSMLFARQRPVALKRLWQAAILITPVLPLVTALAIRIGMPALPLAELASDGKAEAAAPGRSEVDARRDAATITPGSYFADIEPPVGDDSDGLITAGLWPWLAVAYGVGALSLIGLMVGAVLRIRRWTARATPVSDRRVIEAFEVAQSALSHRTPCFVMSAQGVVSPLSVGVFNYRIFVSPDIGERFSDEELRDLALHEMAHIRRADPPMLAAATLVCALFFFNPMIWYAARRLRLLAEHSADDAVVTTTGEAVPYTKLLMRLAETAPQRPMFATLAAGALSNKSLFLRRAEKIVDEERELSGLLSGTLLAVTAAVAFVAAAMLPLSVIAREAEEVVGNPAGWEGWHFPARPDSFAAEHLGVQFPIHFIAADKWWGDDVSDVSSYFIFDDATGREFTICLDRDPRRATVGQWFLGDLSPVEEGVVPVPRGSEQERAVRMMFIGWVAQRCTRRQWELAVLATLEKPWPVDLTDRRLALMIDEVLEAAWSLRAKRQQQEPFLIPSSPEADPGSTGRD